MMRVVAPGKPDARERRRQGYNVSADTSKRCSCAKGQRPEGLSRTLRPLGEGAAWGGRQQLIWNERYSASCSCLSAICPSITQAAVSETRLFGNQATKT